MPAQQLGTDLEKQPVTPVNRPESGTYGEKAELNALQKALPQAEGTGGPAGPGAATTAAPSGPGTPVTSPRSNRDARNLPGVPAPMLRPSDRPNEPVWTPRNPPGSPGPVNAAQRRLALLDVLANSPDVSDETREWAALVIRILTT